MSKYHELPEMGYIRLLRVQDTIGVDDIRLRLTLHAFPLGAELPEFAALSYTWGSPIDDPVVIEQYSSAHDVAVLVSHEDGPFYEQIIGRNLHEALVQIHATHWQSFLWADALCIDQSNVAERSSQVSFMGRIYEKASKVLAWLGQAGSTAEVIVELHGAFATFLNKWHEERKVPYIPRLRHGTSDDQFSIGNRYNKIDLARTDVRCLWSFLQQRRYFRRAWCSQEIFKAADRILLLLGSYTLNRVHFIHILRWAAANWTLISNNIVQDVAPDKLDMTFNNVYSFVLQIEKSDPTEETEKQYLTRIYGNSTERTSALFQLQFALAGKVPFSVSERHDELYSVIGLVKFPPELRSIVRPDYSRSVEEVFTDLTRLLLKELPFMTTFALLCPYDLRKLKGLPSWVPDLTSDFTRRRFPGLSGDPYRRNIDLYDAYPMRNESDCRIEFSGRELRLRGCYCGRIVSSRSYREATGRGHSQYSFEEMSFHIMEYWRYILRLIDQLTLSYPNGQRILEALAQTILNGRHNVSAADAALNAIQFSKWALLDIALFHDMVLSEDPSTAHRARAMDADVLRLLDEFGGFGGLPRSKDVRELRRKRTEQIGSSGDRNMFRRLCPDNNILSAVSLFESQNVHIKADQSTFRLDNNYLGQGPQRLQSGDQVWLLCPAKIPQVLRPQPKKGTFLILGEAYVHGGMDGEFVSRGIAGPIQDITII